MTFYNKYRPKKLSDVIGNTVLVDSLKKQLEENSLPHSFLFYGPSGAGKTTLARVLALSINCEIDNLNPCLSCSSCTQILNNTSPDFKEINTSDLRGIDAMRSLIDMFKYVNFSLKNRVIILDECFPAYTHVMVDYNTAVPISSIVNNEKITHVLSYNLQTKSIRPSKIIRRYKRMYSDKKVDVVFSDGTFLKSTRQHKYYVVGKGYIPAEELNAGDKLIEYAGTYKIGDVCDKCGVVVDAFGSNNMSSHIMKYHRELTSHIDYTNAVVGKKRPSEVTDKMSKSMKKFYATEAGKENRLRSSKRQTGNNNSAVKFALKTMTPSEYSTMMSSRQKKWWNSISREERDFRIKTFINAPKYNNLPNKVESTVISWGISGLKYVGDGSLFMTLTLPSGKIIRKNPDFVYKEDNKVTKIVEIMDFEYWHSNEESADIVKAYKDIGYDCLVVDASRIKKDCFVRGEIEAFVNNHYKEIFKVKLNKSSKPQYVYDIEVENDHNFFVIPAKYKKTCTTRKGYPKEYSSPVLVSNCHSLTNEAMNCLLKSLEEPPKNTYIILCTTDPLKLLETIRTRCAKHEFFGFDFDEKVKLIYRVMDGERKYISDENVTEFAHYVKDSPREILNSIELLFNQADPDTLEAIHAVTLSEGDTSEVVDLIRAIINNDEKKFLSSISVFNSKNLNVEKIRMYVLSYAHKVLLSGKKDMSAHNALKLMSAFTPALEPSSAKYDVMCRFYSCLWGK